MFLMPLSLVNISLLKDPTDRVPLAARAFYEKALSLLEKNSFESFEMSHDAEKRMLLKLFWHDETLGRVTVDIKEVPPTNTLNFSCSHCTEAARQAQNCKHQWASYIVLWQALTYKESDFKNEEHLRLHKTLAKIQEITDEDRAQSRFAKYTNVKFESISLVFDETPLLKGKQLAEILSANELRHKYHEVLREEEYLAPRLWNLPEVFRKKLTAFSESYFNEVNRLNRIVDIVRYNFDNGMQISSRDILRHILHRKVPNELLPAPKPNDPLFKIWSLSGSNAAYLSQNFAETEQIIQNLLAQISNMLEKKSIKVYLQAKGKDSSALELQSIEYDLGKELDWRVEFQEKQDIHSDFKLINYRKKDLFFFDSFAICPEESVVMVHSWGFELNNLQDLLGKVSPGNFIAEKEAPHFELEGELEAKKILKYLRARPIPVKVTGGTKNIVSEKSRTEIRINEFGKFYIQHDARVDGDKNIQRKGFTTSTQLFLNTLNQGIGFILNADPKDIATKARSKRDWDLKILKHVGILQYVFFEALSLHFDGCLSDGIKVDQDDMFKAIHSRVQNLLVSGSVGVFVKENTLQELCSLSVLKCFEDFISLVFKSLEQKESFYSEQGEIIMDGLVEREFRLLYELMRKMIAVTGGDFFKKSRSSFVNSCMNSDFSEIFFPVTINSKIESSMQATIESLQFLIPQGFKVFYKDQPLQELEDDDFFVDFSLETDIKDGQFNWFELNPRFFLKGEEVNPDQILNLGAGGVIEYDGRLYLVPQKQLPSLKRLEKFWEKLQKGKIESSKKKISDKIYQLPRHQTLELLALRASGVKIRGDQEWNKLCEFYDSLGQENRQAILSHSTKPFLKPYQISGVQWLQDLYRLHLGALLADDMGLGKTLQTLSFLDGLYEQKNMGQVLIVVPSSLIFNWQSEIQKFTPNLPTYVFGSKEREFIGRKLESKESMIVIVTYGLLMEHEDFLAQYKWNILIFDEAQNLKNITTKRTASARALNAHFKICLTGTPMENHYGEFYSLVDLLVPGSLGKLEEFRRQFVNNETILKEDIEDLKLKIKPLLLRRTKKEILDQLPEKQETKVSIAFEEKQREIYRDIALSYNQRVQEAMASNPEQGTAQVQIQMLTALLRLRQACSDPASLPNVKYERTPPKLEALTDSLQEIVESGESALVFTQFIQTLERTVSILKKLNIPVYALHGGVPTKQRQKILADFNAEKGGAVLVMTLKTGGVGLNLTKASYVFHLEPWWNPSVENQATDRAHRLGQSKAVQVFRYIMHESLEEKIEVLKNRKDKKFQVLFANTEKDSEVDTGSNTLSKEDFDLLLGLK